MATIPGLPAWLGGNSNQTNEIIKPITDTGNRFDVVPSNSLPVVGSYNKQSVDFNDILSKFNAMNTTERKLFLADSRNLVDFNNEQIDILKNNDNTFRNEEEGRLTRLARENEIQEIRDTADIERLRTDLETVTDVWTPQTTSNNSLTNVNGGTNTANESRTTSISGSNIFNQFNIDRDDVLENSGKIGVVNESSTISNGLNIIEQAGRLPGGLAQGVVKTVTAIPGLMEGIGALDSSLYYDSSGKIQVERLAFDEAGNPAAQPNNFYRQSASNANSAIQNLTDSFVSAPTTYAAGIVGKAFDALGEALLPTATALATGGASTIFSGTALSRGLGALNAVGTELTEGSGDPGMALVAGGAEYLSETIGGQLFDNAANKLTGSNFFGNAAGRALNIAGEGLEENISSLISSTVTGQEYTIDNAIEENLVGMLTGLGLGTVASAAGNTNTNTDSRSVTASNNNTFDLSNNTGGLTFNNESNNINSPSNSTGNTVDITSRMQFADVSRLSNDLGGEITSGSSNATSESRNINGSITGATNSIAEGINNSLEIGNAQVIGNNALVMEAAPDIMPDSNPIEPTPLFPDGAPDPDAAPVRDDPGRIIEFPLSPEESPGTLIPFPSQNPIESPDVSPAENPQLIPFPTSPETQPESTPTEPIITPIESPGVTPDVNPTIIESPEIEPNQDPENAPEVNPETQPESNPEQSPQYNPSRQAEPFGEPELNPRVIENPLEQPNVLTNVDVAPSYESTQNLLAQNQNQPTNQNAVNINQLPAALPLSESMNIWSPLNNRRQETNPSYGTNNIFMGSGSSGEVFSTESYERTFNGLSSY